MRFKTGLASGSSPLTRGRLGGDCLDLLPNPPLTPPIIRGENLCRCTLILFFLIVSSLDAIIVDKIAAIVNNDVITQSEVAITKQLDLHISGLSAEKDPFQQRIDHKLLQQQLTKQPPVPLTDEEVHQEILRYAGRHGNDEQLFHFLNSIGMNYSDFEKEVRDQLSIRRFITERFRPFVNITIEEAERYYENTYVPRRRKEGMEVLPFAESFSEVQNEMVESLVQKRLTEWLEELRQSATINIKD